MPQVSFLFFIKWSMIYIHILSLKSCVFTECLLYFDCLHFAICSSCSLTSFSFSYSHHLCHIIRKFESQSGLQIAAILFLSYNPCCVALVIMSVYSYLSCVLPIIYSTSVPLCHEAKLTSIFSLGVLLPLFPNVTACIPFIITYPKTWPT